MPPLGYCTVPVDDKLEYTVDSSIEFSRWVSYYTDNDNMDYDDYNHNGVVEWSDENGLGNEIKASSGFFSLFFDSSFIDITNISLLDPFNDNTDDFKEKKQEIVLYAYFKDGYDFSKTISKRSLYIGTDTRGNENILVYQIKYAEGDPVTSSVFYLKNNSDKPIDIGNDFVMNFQYKGEKYEYSSFDSTADSSDEDSFHNSLNFFGIVDYKLLDNANLYIDEPNYFVDGKHVGNDYDWNGDSQNFVMCDGSYFNIPSFTWFKHEKHPDINISGAVAYSSGCQDAPEDFYNKMEQQRKCICVANQWAQDNDFIINPNNPDQYYTDWDYTTAPEGKWTYYVLASDFINAEIAEDESLVELDTYDYGDLDSLAGVRPYVPGLSSYDGYDEYYYRGQSAGVDCVGFVQSCAGYDDNLYSLLDLPGMYEWSWNNGYGDGGAKTYGKNRRSIFYTGDNSFTGTAYLSEVTNCEEYLKKGLTKILPGYILYYPNSYHVAIIADVNYDGCQTRGDLSLNKVKLIESTVGTNPKIIGNVTNLRKLYLINKLGKKWRVGKFIID